MSAEERRKILQMVEEGKISAEEAAHLLRAFQADEAEAEVEVIGAESGSDFERTDANEFEEIKARARRFSLIPLWIGIFLTVFSAWIIYSIQQNAGVNFWFYCMILPLMFGVLLIALGAGVSSRWIYINVDRRNARDADGPRQITLGFPLPLGLMEWLFRNFGHNINGVDRKRAGGIAQILEATKTTREPFMVNVNDDGGDRVQVYIG